jgi:hypothetical protein
MPGRPRRRVGCEPEHPVSTRWLDFRPARLNAI